MLSHTMLLVALLLVLAVTFLEPIVASPSALLRQLNSKLSSSVESSVGTRHSPPDMLKHLFMAEAMKPIQDPRGPGVEVSFFEDAGCKPGTNITETNFIPGPLSPQCVNAFGPIYAIENCDRDGTNFLYVLSQDPTCKTEEVSIRAANAVPGKCGPVMISQAGYTEKIYGIIQCYFK